VVLQTVRSDALPERSTYRDRGCSEHPQCLTCPLPECRYVKGLVTMRLERRRASVIALHNEGRSVLAIARRLGMKQRIVRRDLEAV